MEKLYSLTRKWWFYVLLLFLFFIPSYSQISVSPQEINNLILETLSNPLIYYSSTFYSSIKIIFLGLTISLFIVPKLTSKFYKIFITLLLGIIAVFQNMSNTSSYGFSILFGNIILQLIVVAFWVLEISLNKINFNKITKTSARLFILPLTILAFWMPIDNNIKLDFNPFSFFLNESIVTYCMITPVILSLLILSYPHVNKTLLRVMSFVGILFGIINLLTWFLINSDYWWMGVLHIPLISISLFGFILGITKQEKRNL